MDVQVGPDQFDVSRANQVRPIGGQDGVALVSTLAIVAHDLRGPLSNLSALLDLIDAHTHRQALDLVTRSTRQAQETIARLDTLISRFLERTRVSGDPLGFEAKLVDVGDILAEVISLNRPVADARGVRLAIAGAENGPRRVVWGDAALLSEAVENLLGNAIKHAPEGSAVVCSIEREKRAVAISVADEGPGMTDAQLARAVRPFSGGTRRRGHGDSAHGFGLWIVRLIAERHGGSIELRNGAPGAVLTLRLPLDSSRNSEPTEP